MLGVGGFFAAATILASASAAFACVQVIGKLSVTGTNGGTSVAIGNGTHPPFNMYCVPLTNGATAERPTGFSPSQKPLVQITYGPASECNPIPDLGDASVRPGRPNTPADGTYEVNFCPGKVFQSKAGVWGFRVQPLDAGSCHFNDGVGDRGVIMGSMTVAGGSGSAALRIPAGAPKNQPTNASGIAVRRACCGGSGFGAPDMNLVPISII